MEDIELDLSGNVTAEHAAEPHTLENLVTHRFKTFLLSRDCPYVRMFVRAPLEIHLHHSPLTYRS